MLESDDVRIKYGNETLKLLTMMAAMLLAVTTSANAGEEDIRKALDGFAGDMSYADITETEVDGLFQVIVDGNVFYTTASGRYLIAGQMYDTEKRVNLSAPRMQEVKAKQDMLKAQKLKPIVASIKDEQTIVFDTEEEAEHTVTVFTDITCGYCVKLHQQMAAYNAQGIKIRYVLYPRNGLGHPTRKMADKVWCSADRQDAIGRAKIARQFDNEGNCGAPVDEFYALGKSLGVTGTPAIATEQGVLIGGYLPPEALKERLLAIEKMAAGS